MDIHDYQLKLFGNFAGIAIIFWALLKLAAALGIGNETLEWITAIILIIFALCSLMRARDKIFEKERMQITGWTFVLWIVLASFLIRLHTSLGREMRPVDLYFLALTIALADSYFDFKDIPSLHRKI